MKSFKAYLAVIFAFSIFIPAQLFAQENEALIINRLNTVIKPIETLNPTADFKDIGFLKERLKDKELIALGEVTHGTAEVYEYRDRLVRFLVTTLGYKAIAFESDFTALENVDNYITGKTDSLVFLFGSPVISTNRSMIEWLKKYNQDKSDSDKVHVYGIEARGFTNVINKVIELNPSIESVDKVFLEKISLKPYQKIEKQEIKDIKGILTKLRNLEGSDLSKHYIEMLNQVTDGYYETKIGYRDRVMASNIIWIKERAKDNKLILWAHNGHVAKTELYNNPAAGMLLHRKYASKYFMIATDFNSGKAYVNVVKNKSLLGFQPYYFPEVDTKDAYEFYFKQCKFKNFIIDIDEVSKDPILNDFLTRPLNMRMIGATSTPVNKKLSISKNFDMVVFFDKTNSSQ
ncbi:erythromycin esterase family protein [Pedobacter gandavensis]|uniref:erythromycin esterase family protein n=1 Tax=Pedobacter gandavensis TaxID=2679963 RepID=UPI0029300AB9|nr:erythromycin esterase family protein [Pedobacter gandavensis]